MASMGDALAAVGDPSIRHIVSVSGGKDSTALAIYIREKYPQIPMELVFCDTGAELPETYAFLDRLEATLGLPIARLNALDMLNVRHGRGRNPFDYWLQEVYGGFLPNPRSRWCTRVLKIAPFEKFIGNDRAFSYIGIRWDEDREGYKPKKPPVFSEQPNIMPVYPFRDDHKAKADVLKILSDWGEPLPSYYDWRSRSGCYFCFYQQIAEWQGLKANHPSLFEKAKEYETEVNGKLFTWLDNRQLDDVVAGPVRPLAPKDDGDGCAICHL